MRSDGGVLEVLRQLFLLQRLQFVTKQVLGPLLARRISRHLAG